MDSKYVRYDAVRSGNGCDVAHALEREALEANRDGDHERVVALTKRALEHAPSRLRLLMILESALFHLGRLDEAAAVQGQACALIESGRTERGEQS